jgi:hypothetical protein
MENFSNEEALDYLLAICKVSQYVSVSLGRSAIAYQDFLWVYQKTFVASVTVQVVERHLIRDLQRIFSPVAVIEMSSSEVEKIASQPASATRQRVLLQDRIGKLEHGSDIFRRVMGSVAS